jgi:O-antigen/teichoic acid export membrane protein
MQKFRCAAQVASLSVVIQIIGISVGAVTFGVTGALLGYVAGSAVPAFISLKAIRRNPGISAEIKTRVERHARYGWAGAIVAAFVWSRLEVFFLELSVGLGAVALFSAALAFSSLASQGPVLLTRGLFFYFCEEVGKNQTESLPEAFAAATRVTALLVFPACFGTAAIMPKLLPMIYGPEFAGAVPAASVLVCVAGITAAGTIGANLLAALERNDFIFFSGLLGALLATIVGLTIIPQFGIMGAAYGRAAVQTILLALGLWFIGTQAGFSIPYGGLARILAAATLCALAARMTITAIQGSGAIPIAIMTGVIAYVVAVRLVGGLNRGDSAKVLSLMLHLPQWLRAFPVAALKLMEAKS